MSTRSLIAKKTENGWTATYHHWDGYPEGLGATLYELFNGHFEQDGERMVEFLLAHNWSTINDQDFTKEPGWDTPGPKCYCCGGRNEELWQFTDQSPDFSGAEYCYVIDVETSYMTVLERIYSDGSRAVQYFGIDASAVADGVNWKELAVVPLLGPEPDWANLDKLPKVLS